MDANSVPAPVWALSTVAAFTVIVGAMIWAFKVWKSARREARHGDALEAIEIASAERKAAAEQEEADEARKQRRRDADDHRERRQASDVKAEQIAGQLIAELRDRIDSLEARENDMGKRMSDAEVRERDCYERMGVMQREIDSLKMQVDTVRGVTP